MSATQQSYQSITDRLVELLEEGTIPWRKPWNSGEPCQNLLSKKPYRGINPFILNCQPFGSPFWLTFRQAKSLGGHVRRGEKGTPIWFWEVVREGRQRRREEAHSGSTSLHGVLGRAVRRASRRRSRFSRIRIGSRSPRSSEPKQIVGSMPQRPEIRHGGRQAFYAPLTDSITMPERDRFASPPEYYSTLFHELVHATGHELRLGRKGIRSASARFGSPTYSKEELVAEMGAAYVCGEAQIEKGTLENSAAYIRGWIAKLKGDATLAVKAAGAAQKAADFILDRKPAVLERQAA